MIWVCIGAMLSPAPLLLHGVSMVWPYWPFSQVDVVTQGPILSANSDCVGYQVSMMTVRGFDDAYLKIRFPMAVSDMKAGVAKADAMPSEVSSPRGTITFGKDSDGVCKIVRFTGQNESGVEATVQTQAIVIRVAKAEPRTSVVALVVGTDNSPGIGEQKLVHVGHFFSPLSFWNYSEKKDMRFVDSQKAVVESSW